MIELIEFSKLSGSGNDFICVDNRDGRYDEILESPQRVGHFARELCHRGTGVGADGVIFAIESEVPEFADVGARFLEADGTEADLCGNGTGCFTKWAIEEGFLPDGELRILTPAGVIRSQVADPPYIRVCIPEPREITRDIPLHVEDCTWVCDFVRVGIGHCVTFVDDIDAVDVAHWGRALRHHPYFAPEGANANFVQVLGEGEIALRTFEYGVEGETLACGTGSAASAILSALRLEWPEESFTQRPIRVRARSGDTLRICFARRDGRITDVCLETVVRYVYRGTVHPCLLARAIPEKMEI